MLNADWSVVVVVVVVVLLGVNILCFYLIYFNLFNLLKLKMEWSDAKTLQLIELYEKRPYLYDFSVHEYQYRVSKLQGWTEIAAEFGTSGIEFRILAPLVT